MGVTILKHSEFERKPLPIVETVVTQQLILLPLYFFLPFWLTIVSLVIAAVVLRAELKGEFTINRWLKVALTLVAFILVFVSFRKISGRDGGVGLISLMYAFKSLEIKKPRDVNVILSLGFFILLAGFLFSQSPMIVVYQVIPIMMILHVLVMLNSVHNVHLKFIDSRSIKFERIKPHVKYIFLALPIMFVFFVFFPRLGGPLWSMPGMKSAVSGVSDTMMPGEISDLQLSDEIAFRVKFNTTADNQSSLVNKSNMYWRVMTMNHFDGVGWSRRNVKIISNPNHQLPEEAKVSYEITLEATNQKHLVALDRPLSKVRIGNLYEDYSVVSAFKIYDRIRYSATSSPTLTLDQIITPEQQDFFTRLPAEGNEKTKEWAQNTRQLYESDAAFIQSILAKINKEEYFYSLSPPTLDEDLVDSFWFDYKIGFCEHYASTLVFIARAAGIPARVVVGYQGGDKNPLADYWIVRYADAHAWTEIWLQGRGWVRVDPTSAIAAHRVEEVLRSDFSFRDSLFEDIEFVDIDNLSAFKQMTYWFDNLNSQWNDWVLGYNRNMQRKLFSSWGLSGFNQTQLIVIMIIAVMFFTLLSGFNKFANRDKRTPIAKAFNLVCKNLASKNIVAYDAAIGPEHLRQLLINRKAHYYRHGGKPNSAYDAIIDSIEQYIKLRYSKNSPSDDQEAINKLIRQMKKATSRLSRLTE